MNTGFRFYFDKDLDFILKEELEDFHPYTAERRAKQRLRMYANLYSRDVKKQIVNDESICVFCGVNTNLTIDHIQPISKGGKNEISNVQILCSKCNCIKHNKTATNGRLD